MIYQKALTLNNDDDYYTFLPILYTKLGDAFKNLSDWFNAQKYYELAVEFYISTGDTEKICEIKYEIANLFYITFKPDKANKLLIDILSNTISLNLEIKSKLLLANITGQWYIDEIPKDTSSIDKPILAELYFKYALNLDKNGDIPQAIRYYKKCVETSQDRLVNAYLSSSLTNLASIYNEDGRSDMAIKYLQESVRLDELSKNYNGIYVSTMKLAEINANRDSNKALEYIKKSKVCAIELNDSFLIASADIAIGDYHNKHKDYKQALQHYNAALKLAKENFTKDNINKIEMRIADIKKVYNGA
jgi:tetratricopeptide (TPR) repeat protein